MARSIKNLIAAVLIAISGYLGWSEILPAYSVISFLQSHIGEKTEDLKSRTEIVKKIENLRNESNSKYSELQRLALVVPKKKGFPELITAIENIYSQSGITLPEITLGASDTREQLNQIKFNAEGEGDYIKFLTFLDYLERNIRLYDVDSIDISLNSLNLSDPNPELNFNIEGRFYWLLSADISNKN